MRKTSCGEWAAAIAVMAVTAALVGHAWGGSGAPDNNALCARRVTTLTFAILGYTQDYDERFPALGTPTRLYQDLTPYLPPDAFHNCPETGLAYVGNGTIQFVSRAAIANPSTTELLRDATAHSDGISTVAFADGHVDRGGVEQGQYELMCQARAHNTARALLMYAQDYDERLPATGSAAEMQPPLTPYLGGNLRNLYCPATQQPFTPNPALSRQPLSTFYSSDWHELVALSDPTPHANGVSTVAYLDGHVERDGVNHENTDTACDTHLSYLNGALAMYAQDYDGHLPPSMTGAALGTSLAPYLGGIITHTFSCPDTGLNYQFNNALAGLLYESLPPGTELVRDLSSHRDGHNAVVSVVSPGHFGVIDLRDQRSPWTPLALATGSNSESQLLWMRSDGTTAAVVRVSPSLETNGTTVSLAVPAPAAPRIWNTVSSEPAVPLPYTPVALSVAPNSEARVLWDFVSLFPYWSVSSFNSWRYPDYGYPDPLAEYRYFWGPTPLLVIQTLDPTTGAVSSARATTPLTGWKAKALATGPDGASQQLWVSEDGGAATITPPLPDTVKQMRLFIMRMGYGWRAVDFTISQDGMWKVLWQRRDGAAALMEATTNIRGLVTRSVVLGPDPGWTAVGVASGALDNRAWVLWRNRARLGRVQRVASRAVPHAAIPVPALAGEVVPQGISVGGDGQLRIWGGRHTDGAASVSLLSPAGEVITSRILLPPSS